MNFDAPAARVRSHRSRGSRRAGASRVVACRFAARACAVAGLPHVAHPGIAGRPATGDRRRRRRPMTGPGNLAGSPHCNATGGEAASCATPGRDAGDY